jgi:hypothetical protein
VLPLPPLMRRSPSPSRSSIGAFNHSLISRSTCRSTMRRATDLRRSECGIVSKYFDRSAVYHVGVAPAHEPVHFLVDASIAAKLTLPPPGTAASPFQRAVSTTPADRTGACVDCFPAHSLFLVIQAGRHPRFEVARTSFTLRPAGSLNRPRRPSSRGFGPFSCPNEPLVSYQINENSLGRIFLHW